MHRMPADTSTMSSIEKAFEPLARGWVEAEAHSDARACPDAGPIRDQEMEVLEVDPPGSTEVGSSFTPVLIGNVKPEVLRQIAEDLDGLQLCRCTPETLALHPRCNMLHAHGTAACCGIRKYAQIFSSVSYCSDCLCLCCERLEDDSPACRCRVSCCVQGHQAPVPLLPARTFGQAARAGWLGRRQGRPGARHHHSVPQGQQLCLEEEPQGRLR